MIEGYNVNMMNSHSAGLPSGPDIPGQPPVPREPYKSYQTFGANAGPFVTFECNDGTAISLRLDCLVSMAYSQQHQTLRIYSSMGSEIVLRGRNLKELHQQFTDERVKTVCQFNNELHQEPDQNKPIVERIEKG